MLAQLVFGIDTVFDCPVHPCCKLDNMAGRTQPTRVPKSAGVPAAVEGDADFAPWGVGPMPPWRRPEQRAARGSADPEVPQYHESPESEEHADPDFVLALRGWGVLVISDFDTLCANACTLIPLFRLYSQWFLQCRCQLRQSH